jgi:hypothetical protein
MRPIGGVHTWRGKLTSSEKSDCIHYIRTMREASTLDEKAESAMTVEREKQKMLRKEGFFVIEILIVA